MRGILAAAVIWSFAALGATAQSVVPEGRFAVSSDTDFYGSDLSALFDTDLAACIRACANDRACTALTFNSRSGSCFPKSAVSDRTPYAGAISARLIPTDPGVLARAPSLQAQLGFLSPDDLAAAGRQARDLGFRHPVDDRTLDELLSVLGTAQGTPAAALNWTGMALSLSGRADLWTEYARLSLLSAPERAAEQRRARERALSAATNGYL